MPHEIMRKRACCLPQSTSAFIYAHMTNVPDMISFLVTGENRWHWLGLMAAPGNQTGCRIEPGGMEEDLTACDSRLMWTGEVTTIAK